MLQPSDIDPDGRVWIEESERIEAEMVAEFEVHGPYASGATKFATGHHTEDRLVWFDILTVTLDDIMRECAVPEEQREQRRLRYRSYAKDFLQHHDSPEKTLPRLKRVSVTGDNCEGDSLEQLPPLGELPEADGPGLESRPSLVALPSFQHGNFP